MLYCFCEDKQFILLIKIYFITFAIMAKKKHGLKGKPSNNPNGRGEQQIKKEQVGIYIEVPIIEKLGGKSAIRDEFTKLITKLSIR